MGAIDPSRRTGDNGRASTSPRRPRSTSAGSLDHNSSRWTGTAAWLAVGAIIAVAALIRLRLAGAPLERDEGEYAYAGQLLLGGIPPYSLAYNMKFPGTYFLYAAMLRVFGQSAWGIHVGLLAVNAASTALLFVIGRRLLGTAAAIAAAAFFALLSLDSGVLGIHAHATHFIVFALLAAVAFLGRARATARARFWIAAGACLGAAVVIDQHGALFAPLGLVLAVWELPPERRLRCLTAFAAGLAAVPCSVALVLAWQGVLQTAAFWTFSYARAYVSEVPWASAWRLFTGALATVTAHTREVWALGALGLAAFWIRPAASVDSGAKRLLTGWLIAALAAISPGFYYRPHYFVLLLPAVALLAGAGVLAIAGLLSRAREYAAPLAVALVPLFVCTLFGVRQARYLFTAAPETIVRETFVSDPFNEAVAVAGYLRAHTSPDDRIAVLGSEPEIYFYAQRRSATGYIYMYPLLERQPYAESMAREMLDEIEAARPAYLVVVSVTNSWFNGLYGGLGVLDWVNRYSSRCFDRVGLIDMDAASGGRALWDATAQASAAHPSAAIYTLRRKSEEPCREPLEK